MVTWCLLGVYLKMYKSQLILCFYNTNIVRLHINTMWSECTIWQNEVATTQFIGLQIGCKLKWEMRIKYVNPRLSSACYVMMITLPMKIET